MFVYAKARRFMDKAHSPTAPANSCRELLNEQGGDSSVGAGIVVCKTVALHDRDNIHAEGHDDGVYKEDPVTAEAVW